MLKKLPQDVSSRIVHQSYLIDCLSSCKKLFKPIVYQQLAYAFTSDRISDLPLGDYFSSIILSLSSKAVEH